jgi:hypothetical protein
MTLAKNLFAFLFAIQVAGWQACTVIGPAAAPARELAAARFPGGTYMTCAQGAHTPNGNIFLNSSGFQSGATLTLSQSDAAVNATYVDQNGLSKSLNFTTVTATSAALAQPAQVSVGLSGLCVRAPRSSAPYPTTMNATAGAMTYNAGTVFVTLTGALESDAGTCGRLSQPDATFWLLCKEREGGPLRADAAAPPAATQLPVGRYSCSSQIGNSAQVGGVRNVASGGATGTLTLAQQSTKLSAAYAGDSYIVGTLRFDLASSTTAGTEGGQTLQARCTIPMGGGVPSQTIQALNVAAGSLSLVGSKLVVSFSGTMGSSCANAQVAGSLICSKQP